MYTNMCNYIGIALILRFNFMTEQEIFYKIVFVTLLEFRLTCI